LLQVLNDHREDLYPLLGDAFRGEDFCKIDLSTHQRAFDVASVQTYAGLNEYIQSQLKKHNAKVGVGGYLEKRLIYQQSGNFKNSDEDRNIHLGVDYWCAAGTKIFAPLDSIVHSYQYNTAYLDYGATIILQHELAGHVFYTLYGHLTLASLQPLFKGMKISKGVPFTATGHQDENGGWVPHLHFQIIKNMQGREGDYPGVASAQQLKSHVENCPDPEVFFVY
ncbi:MAG: peptidoglycan DD-metalloendopeptidase family protein, partial [Bacteroidota bacterium]